MAQKWNHDLRHRHIYIYIYIVLYCFIEFFPYASLVETHTYTYNLHNYIIIIRYDNYTENISKHRPWLGPSGRAVLQLLCSCLTAMQSGPGSALSSVAPKSSPLDPRSSWSSWSQLSLCLHYPVYVCSPFSCSSCGNLFVPVVPYSPPSSCVCFCCIVIPDIR